MNLRAHRNALRMSQSRLARMSGVSRTKICLYELDDGLLTLDEQGRIREALRKETERFRHLAAEIDFGQSDSTPAGDARMKASDGQL